MISSNFLKELSSKPPASNTAYAKAEGNLDINQKYMMRSVTNVRQLSPHISFFLFSFAIEAPKQ